MNRNGNKNGNNNGDNKRSYMDDIDDSLPFTKQKLFHQ